MSVPKLRFKTDDGSDFPEWEKNNIGTYLSIRNEKQVPTEEAPLKAFIAYKGVADKGDRYDRSFLVKSEDKQYKRTELNDFIYSSNNLDVGSIGLNTYGTAVISDVYEVFNPKENVFPTVLNAAIQRKAIINAILRFRQGCLYGQYKIYPENFLSVKISMPSLLEQQKIADFFSAIDLVIDQTQSEIDAWEKQKRGVMQLLFSQKIRFKADDGSEFPEWEEKTLIELGKFLKGAPLSKSDVSEDGIPLILYGELYTTYNEIANKIIRRTKTFVDEKYLSRTGDVVLPTSGETPEEISTATCVMQDGVVLAGDLNIYRTSEEIDGRIMSYLLNHQINRDIARIAQGKSIVHVNARELGKLPVCYPKDISEQQKIAACLSAFDDVIDKSKKELDAYRELKKGLLQQMFV